MKYLLSSAFIFALALGVSSSTRAQEVTLVAPGDMKCSIDQMKPGFEQKTGYTLKATIGSGGATHKQVVQGAAFDVPIVQQPYQDVIDSGNVVKSTETPLATVPLVVVIKKGNPMPDISSAEAFKKTMLDAKAVSYPDGAHGTGGAAGVSFDETQKKLGIYDEVQAKVKREKGVSLLKLVTNGDIDFAITYPSEVNDPDVEIVGELPKSISTPTALSGFVSSHATDPKAAKALLSYLSSPEAAVAYKACHMKPER